MKRECGKCGRAYFPDDLARGESKGMEAERKAAGLEGVRFLYYQCPCGGADVFVDVLPRDDELAEDYERRRAAMEEAVRRVHAQGVTAQVVPVSPRD